MTDFVTRSSSETMTQSPQVKVKEETCRAKRSRAKTCDTPSDEDEIKCEAVDYKPSPPPTPPVTPKRRGRHPGSGQKGSPTKKVKTEGGAPTKTGTWRKDELVQLYYAVYPEPSKINWADVAAGVPGRDKLSCSNKFRYNLQPKLDDFVRHLGQDPK